MVLVLASPLAATVNAQATALTGAGHDGDAGVPEHWDYNLRQVVAGPPQEWPVIPTTYAEALEYIQDPEAWNF